MTTRRFAALATTATLVVSIFAGAGAGVDPMSRSDSKPSHHVEGGFRNPDGGPGHGDTSIAVTLPFFARRLAASLSRAPVPVPARVANDGVFLRANALGSVPTVTWVGHSTLIVQMGHVTFLTDPTWSSTASPIAVGPRRFVEPGIAFDDLPDVDFAVVSHNHYDHLDLSTLARLAKRGTRIYVPLGNGKLLESEGIDDVVELDWWQHAVFEGVTVHCVPARHWSRRGAFDGDRSLWSGWVVAAEGRRFYFAGDTGMFDGFSEIGRRLGPFDLAAVPIGAYEPSEMMRPSHVTPEEALLAVQSVGAKSSVAIHFGTFDLSDEPIDEPPRRYLAASRAASRGPDQDWVLAIGETRQW